MENIEVDWNVNALAKAKDYDGCFIIAVTV
jgi:hypothetical protein